MRLADTKDAEPSQQEKLYPDGQHGIDRSLVLQRDNSGPFVFALELFNDGFDGISSSHVAFDDGREAALLAAGEDLVSFAFPAPPKLSDGDR